MHLRIRIGHHAYDKAADLTGFKDQVLSLLEQELGVSSATEAMGIDRQIIMSNLYKYAGITNRQIGIFFHCDYSTVSQYRRRLRHTLERDSALRRLVAAIEEKMSSIKIRHQ